MDLPITNIKIQDLTLPQTFMDQQSNKTQDPMMVQVIQ